MATTREEAIVELGLSTTKLQSKLNDFSSSFKSSISNFARSWGGALTGGAIIAGITSIINKFDDLKDRADNLGASTDFLQGFTHIASKDAVGGIGAFNKAIEQLSNNLGAAKTGSEEAVKKFQKYGFTIRDIQTLDAEGMFYKIADRIKATQDPAQRMNLAFELLGKSGKGMVGVLSQGADQLRRMVGEADKLDIEKIKQLAQAKDKIEDVGNTLTIFGGWLLGSGLGKLTGKDKTMSEMEKRIAAFTAAGEAGRENRAPVDETNFLKKQYDTQVKLAKLREQMREVDLPKLNQLQAQANRIAEVTRDLSVSEEDRMKAWVDLKKKQAEIRAEEIRQRKESNSVTQTEIDTVEEMLAAVRSNITKTPEEMARASETPYQAAIREANKRFQQARAGGSSLGYFQAEKDLQQLKAGGEQGFYKKQESLLVQKLEQLKKEVQPVSIQTMGA